MWRSSRGTGEIQGVGSVGGLGTGPTTVGEWRLRLRRSREGDCARTGRSR